MKKPDFSKLKTSFADHWHNIGNGGKSLVLTVLAAFFIMILFALVVFFSSVRGAERVMVPDVVGKSLEEGLLELQAKELYGKILLKYTDSPDDKGMILAQDPKKGELVKAYRRVNITVSRGAVLDKVADYKGMNIEDAKASIKTAFAGQTPLITVLDPAYKDSDQPEGTILQQSIEAGTALSSPVKIKFIVSKGNDSNMIAVPAIVGKNVKDVLNVMRSTQIVFDFNAREAAADETKKMGTVSGETMPGDETVKAYTRVPAEMLTGKTDDGMVYGVFSTRLAVYPYPVSCRLEATDAEGNKSDVIKFNHPGSTITIPYAVKAGTSLTLYVADKETVTVKVE